MVQVPMPESSAPRSGPLALLERMLLIRRFEERLIALYEAGAVRGHYHVYIGQEATGVAAIGQLRPSDYLFSTHRNHGHLLARGVDPERLLAEILGRATGLNGGRSGTLHPVAPALGVLHTSGIVAGSLPIAAGAAFSARRRGTDQVTMAFFGDGVLEEGAFYEAINMAALWQLPLVLVCENNSIPPHLRAAGQYPSSTHAAKELVNVPRSFSIEAHVVDGTDPEAVREVATAAVRRAREGSGPTFIEARTSRWPGNYPLFPFIVGAPTDITWSWRPDAIPADLRDWAQQSDPILGWIRHGVEEGTLTRDDVTALDLEVTASVAAVADAALRAPWPEPASALEKVLP